MDLPFLDISCTGKNNKTCDHLGLGLEVKASACNTGDLGLIPGSGRSPGEGNGNPLHYSCLETPMDGGAWWATVHGVAKSRTRLSDFTFTGFIVVAHGLSCPEACGILSPGPGMEPASSALEGRVLTTGPSRKMSLTYILVLNISTLA